VGPVLGSSTLTHWLGVLAGTSAKFDGRFGPGIVQTMGIGALVVVWLISLSSIASAGWREDTVWRLAGWWAAPFVLGPPLLSSDLYSYAAQGAMIVRGLDPYSAGPAALGGGDALQAVDPVWRNVPSPYGPLTGVLEHAAVTFGGSPLRAVLALRLAAVVSVVVIGVCAAALATDRRRATAVALTVLNPLVLLHIVSGAHLEGVMMALVMVALVVTRRSPVLALVAACAAAAVKAPAAAAIVLIVAYQWRSVRGVSAWPARLGGIAAVAGCWGALTVLFPNSWGWLGALTTPTMGYTRGSPTALLGDVLSAFITWAPSPDAIAASRAVGLVAAGCVVGYLALTIERRPLNRSVGYALLAVAVLGPVIYPWYLLWGLICLAPTAASLGERRLVVATSAFACFMGLTGLSHVGVMISEALLGVAGITVALWWWGPADLQARVRARLPRVRERSLIEV
jgi:hypothetical protein